MVTYRHRRHSSVHAAGWLSILLAQQQLMPQLQPYTQTPSAVPLDFSWALVSALPIISCYMSCWAKGSPFFASWDTCKAEEKATAIHAWRAEGKGIPAPKPTASLRMSRSLKSGENWRLKMGNRDLNIFEETGQHCREPEALLKGRVQGPLPS